MYIFVIFHSISEVNKYEFQKINMVIVTGTDEFDSDSESKHIFVSLKDIDSQIKLEFAGALKKASEHVTKLCKQEKEAWVTLDEMQDRFKFLVSQVESKC